MGPRLGRVDSKQDREPDMVAPDRGEGTDLMEPMMIGESSRHRTGLTDLAIELTGRSTGFRRSLPEGVTVALSQLVRAMNCYYSNLIEGHDAHPVDIERALRNDCSADARNRDLLLEAVISRFSNGSTRAGWTTARLPPKDCARLIGAFAIRSPGPCFELKILAPEKGWRSVIVGSFAASSFTRPKAK
jgi:hypothetical protein